MIEIPIPKRQADHKNVVGLTVEPIPTVRIEIVGMGERGLKALRRLASIPGAEVVAVRDNDPNHQAKAEQLLKELQASRKVPSSFLPPPSSIDLTYICTDWQSHTPLAIDAMRKGRHVAVEVPAAITLNDIWQLIDTAEETRRHCMMLENCVYDYFEMATAAMAQAGLFGEIIHVEGGYGHPIGEKWTHWRLDINKKTRGDIYPTHGMGPACMLLKKACADRLQSLVSMDTASFLGPRILQKYGNITDNDFRNGDQTTTIIRTQQGRTITLNHNVMSPRPYTRFYQIIGTQGFVQKDPVPFIIYTTPDGAEHRVQGDDCEEIISKYLPKDILEWREEGARLDSRGGMAYHMDRRMIEHLRRGEPMDMDVYDMADWCAVIPLSELSIEKGFQPVSFPDFRRIS